MSGADLPTNADRSGAQILAGLVDEHPTYAMRLAALDQAELVTKRSGLAGARIHDLLDRAASRSCRRLIETMEAAVAAAGEGKA